MADRQNGMGRTHDVSWTKKTVNKNDNDNDNDNGNLNENASLNENGNGNNWAIFDLEGTTSNRDGIGAKIEVLSSDQPGAARNLGVRVT